MSLLVLDSLLYDPLGLTTYDEKFSFIANNLIQCMYLNISGVKYSFIEVEFYLYTDDHKDIYTHRDADQAIPENWYFHKSHGGSYKGGTYKGLDITFGYSKKKSYGGILIRGIKDMKTNSIISGPCNVVNFILTRTNSSDIPNLIDKLKGNVFNKDNIFYLDKLSPNLKVAIYNGPRVGLSFKYPNYVIRNYRYLTKLDHVKKYKGPILLNLLSNGISESDVCKMSRTKQTQFDKIIKLFKDGQKLKNLSELKPSNTNIILACGFLSNKN